MPPIDYTSADILDPEHRFVLDRAVSNILATEIALNTYAQIIDGLPISDVAWDTRGTKITPAHPINYHTKLCQGTFAKAEECLRDFDLASLVFKFETLDAFHLASPFSRAFNLRLIELTASAVHQIAVLLIQLDLRLHDPATTQGLGIDQVTEWERPPSRWPRIPPYPTLFTQSHFIGHAQYPDGVADMVGYWAEDRIVGGVILFDHSQEWNRVSGQEDEPNAYIHPGRDKVTYRICQLLDEQQEGLLYFLKSGPEPPEGMKKYANAKDGPLPILPHAGNRVRINQNAAIPIYKVYRDPWEREAPRRRLRMQEDMDADRHVLNDLDYPELEMEEQMKRLNKLRERPPP